MKSVQPSSAFLIVLCIILACVILCNGIGLYLLRSISERRPQRMILMSLSSVDILLALCWIVYLSLPDPAPAILLSISIGLYVIWYAMVYFLTVDRFIGITFPMKHKVIIDERFVRNAILSCWACGVLLSVIISLTNPKLVHQLFISYIFTVFDAVFVFIFLFSYASILVRLLHRPVNSTQQNHQSHHRFFAAASGILVAFLFFEALPSLLETFLPSNNSTFQNVRSLLYTFNLLCDPILYTFLQPKVRTIASDKARAFYERFRFRRRNTAVELEAMGREDQHLRTTNPLPPFTN